MSKIVIGLMLTVFAIGCQKTSEGGTTTGNPMISFKMTGSSAATTVAYHRQMFPSPWWGVILKPALALPPPSMTDANNLSVALNEAWVIVKEVEFKSTETADSDEVDGAEVTFAGPYTVNLLSNIPESFGQSRITTNTIRRVKMKLATANSLPSNAPAGLTGKSIFWKGSVNGHVFTITSSEGYEYELGGPNSVLLSDNSNVLMSIHISNIVKKMNFADINASSSQVDISESNRLVTSSAPCPLIDASATDIYTCFTKGLQSESNLGRDDNDDDELSGEDRVK